ncbi:16S rRNA (cytidine(1402)-2'-O)-methyltransferase [Maritimibacter sp. DP4N28-5]|uniref:Ribosomal RNA small subunit methyltransferase I n=1 Tax=Maritimibacter dapengensis TaxID=2836868 RepID=A0ABS6T6T1_9RHOB|nr:16S rRNA (cytidine(1402)-2'-O)-methyltransferase [Maritimibacter dapengensis]
MKPKVTPLDPGLYLVATPIGNARDITLRALDILASADVIAAEDTRTARKLLSIHGIAIDKRPLIPYHDHSGPDGRAGLMKLLSEDLSVALVSEAGTPLIADPGYALAREAGAAGHMVTSAPGASAVPTALSLSGLPTDRFLFAGFPPSAKSSRRTWLIDLLEIPATLILYESPRRINDTLADLCELGASERQVALCRELTKKFEEVRRGTLAELRRSVEVGAPKGEIVLVVDRGREEVSKEAMEEALRKALETMRVKDAASTVAEAFGLPKRQVYQAALEIGKGQ